MSARALLQAMLGSQFDDGWSSEDVLAHLLFVLRTSRSEPLPTYRAAHYAGRN